MLHRFIQQLAFIMLLTAGLAACVTSQPASVPTGKPTIAATTVPTSKPTALATAIPTSAPATPVPAALVGPEWTLLATGDLHGDGVEIVIAYKPTLVGLSNRPANYADYNIAASEIAIVHRGVDGKPAIDAIVTTRAVFMGGSSTPATMQGSGPTSSTAALLLSLPSRDAALRVIPVGPNGDVVGGLFGFTWNSGSRVHELQQLGGAPNTPATGWPGPGWKQIHEGDFNGDGFVERVYYKPSSLQPDPTMRTPVYSKYTVVAEEVLIGQIEPNHAYPLATIDLSNVRGQGILATLVSPSQGPENSPYAFLLAAPSDADTPVAVIPLNVNGQGYTQGFGLRWDPAKGDYRLAGAVFGDPPQRSSGKISGRVGYPSEGVPPMDLYIVSVDDATHYYKVPVGGSNGSFFTLSVDPGRYHLIAYLTMNGNTMAGAYTEFSRCGLSVECADHSLITVAVAAGATVEGVEVTDWYVPAGSFPPRPE